MAASNGANPTIFDTMIQFLKEDDWRYEQLEGRPIVGLRYKGDNGAWGCYAQARDERQQFLFYSVVDVNTPPAKQAAMAEFLTRANYGLLIGNFEMDYSDGQVRYKTSIDVQGDRLTTALVKRLVYINVMMMDRYLPGIMSVIYADVVPAEAIAKIEGQ